MFIFTYTAAVLSIFGIGAAVFIFIKKRRDVLAGYFGAYVLFVAIWVGSNAMADLSVSDGWLRFWSGLALSGGAFFISAYLAFAEYFATERPIVWWKQTIFFLPSLIFAPIGFTSIYVTATMFPPDSPAQIIPGRIAYAVLAYTIVGMVYGLIRPLSVLRSAKLRKKWQILYVSIGFFATMAGAIVFTIILPFMGEFRFFTLGPQFTVVAIILTAYAIFRHQLLDIRIVIQRSLIYLILLILIISFYLTLLIILSSVISSSVTSLLSGLITAVLGILGAPKIEKYFRKKTDAWFFKDRYDYSDVVHQLSELLNKNINLEEVIKISSQKLKSVLKTKDLTIQVVASGSLAPDGKHFSVPICFEDKCVGLITLGDKLSGDPYTNEDMKLLQTFSHQAATALERAKLFKEIKEYSEELENKVEERTAKVRNLQEEQRQIMVDISHGLQTPLTVVKSKLSFLKKQFPGDSSINVFEKSIDDVSKLIYDMMKLVKLEDGFEAFKKERVDLSQLLQEQVEYFSVLAKEAGVEIQADIKPGLVVFGNHNKLSEAVTNLASNAFKYMKPVQEKKLRITLNKERGMATLTVEDNGIGIDPGDLPYVFNRFYRGRGKRDFDSGGTGLGLAIVKKIIEKHDGTISIESQLRQGTKFKVQLPLLN